MIRKIILISISIGIIYLILSFSNVFKIWLVSDNSMQPNLGKGNLVFFSRFGRIYNNRICLANVNGKKYLGRIAGTEGESIEINDGYLLRNGFMTDNPDKVIFKYYIRAPKFSEEKIFKRLKIRPVFRNDTIIFSLNYPEYKEISRLFFLQKVNRKKEGEFGSIYSGWNSYYYGPVIIPKGFCFVLCDNRDCIDSRNYGLVSEKDIIPAIY